MGSENFDEYQLAVRRRIAFQALIITLALICINGVAATYYDWASPMVQALVIISLSALYFLTATVFKSAYVSRKVRNPLSLGVFYLVIGLLNGAIFFARYRSFGAASFAVNGRLSDDLIQLIAGFVFAYLGAILLIKYYIDCRGREE